MDFSYIDYTITQSGKELISESSIKIQKCENRVTRILLNIEEWLAESARLYLAMMNPETKKYHYEPVLNNGTNYYVIIGTQISYYPGKHKIILIGVSPSFELDDNITFDLSNSIYVSREFNRLNVVDNFISDEAVQLSMPNLDYALDNFMVLHNNVVTLSDQIAEYETNCNEDFKQCNEILDECKQTLSECENILDQIKDIQSNLNSFATVLSNQYSNYLTGLQRAYNEYRESIENGGEP